MEPGIMITLIIFGTMFICGGIVVLAVAGKDIFFAFYRLINKKGSDVFIANSNKVITRYYRVPKDNQIKIGEYNYTVNPKKVLTLSEYDKEKVIKATEKRKQRIQKRIDSLEEEKLALEQDYSSIKDIERKNAISAQISSIESSISIFKSKLRLSQEVYLHNKRTALFYMEGDPIPKDFYEFYSNVDCQILDNIVKRAATTSFQEDKDKEIAKLKLLIMGAGGCALAALIYTVMMKTKIDAIALKMGVQ
jgi:hypothetical protein